MNPFDDAGGAVYGQDARDACRAYVEEKWTDLRPASLIAAMAG
ncbi:MbtH protein [Streptomyces sp. yr375]|nr:MbtH protein [Streptomyces sp. yr375]